MAVQAQQFRENVGFSLGDSQEWMDYGGGFCDFYFNTQQQQQQQTQQIQDHQINANLLGFDNSPVLSSSHTNLPCLAFPQPLASQIEKQRLEIDRFIRLQNERLSSALQEQRRQQLAILLNRIESKALTLMRLLDENRAKAAKRTMELEDCLRTVEMENQTWMRIAKENEAMVLALNNSLERVREKASCFFSGVDDAESRCDSSREKSGDNRVEEKEQTKKMACKVCNSRCSCVLFLPCRHLCSCKSCEAFLDSCPVCKSLKKASMEIFLF